jgi:hypothetical protein
LGLRGNPIPKIRRHPVHAEGVVEIVKLEKINFPVASVQRVSAYIFRATGLGYWRRDGVGHCVFCLRGHGHRHDRDEIESRREAAMTSRKKPGVAFWATVGLAVLMLYVLSFGPLEWMASHDFLPEFVDDEFIGTVYWPVVWLAFDGPEPVRDAILCYESLWR